MSSCPSRRSRRIALLTFGLSGLFACAAEDELTLRAHGAEVGLRLDPFSFTVRDGWGTTVLRSRAVADAADAYGGLSASIDSPSFPGQLIPGWDGYRAAEDRWRGAGRAEVLLDRSVEGVRTVTLRVEGAESSQTVEVSVRPGRVQLRVVATPLVPHDPEGPYTKTSLAFELGADEHFFGLGERYATFDHRGWSLYSWAEEAGVGKGDDVPPGADNPIPNGPSMTYFPVPFFLSSAGYGLYLDTTYRSEMHLGSEQADAWRLAVNADHYGLTIYPSPSPIESLARYTEDTGRPPVPAPWVFGPRRRSGGGSVVDGVPEWRAFRERGVPTTAIDDAVHFLPASSHVGRETQLAAWTTLLHQQGYKAIAYNNPYVANNDARAAADFAYGRDNGLFLLNAEGVPGETFFVSGSLLTLATIDLTTDAGREWFKDLLRRTLSLGYDGWMHDFGEYVGRDWTAADGRLGDELHNAFPVLSARAAQELLDAERPNDYLFFVRSGYAGTQRYVPAVWGGDPEASFDATQGLPAALRGGLNLALSGVPYWGSDISGFKCYGDGPRDKEMYLRWTQVGAVSPIMQDQNACVYLLERREKWTLWSDEETTRVYGEMARLHTRLQPYFSTLAEEARSTGTPLMRPPYLYYPKEPETWIADGVFFLGRALLAAPVIERGARERTVWLPPGTYVDWNDGSVYQGPGRVTVPAPLDRLPLFLVSGQILPLLDPSIDTLAPATDPSVVTPADVADRLDVRVVLLPGEKAHLRLSDGTTLTAERFAAEVASPTSLAEVSVDAVADCAGCVAEVNAPLSRLLVSTWSSAASDLEVRDVRLTVADGPRRRVRWDISRP